MSGNRLHVGVSKNQGHIWTQNSLGSTISGPKKRIPMFGNSHVSGTPKRARKQALAEVAVAASSSSTPRPMGLCTSTSEGLLDLLGPKKTQLFSCYRLLYTPKAKARLKVTNSAAKKKGSQLMGYKSFDKNSASFWDTYAACVRELADPLLRLTSLTSRSFSTLFENLAEPDIHLNLQPLIIFGSAIDRTKEQLPYGPE